jgi:hypothetical protein
MKYDVERDANREPITSSKVNMTKVRLTIAAFLGIACLFAVFASVPLPRMSVAASTAMPAATPDPDEVLTEESAGALIDDYSGALMDILIGDEAKVNEIVGGWDAATLAGKTRGQVMTLLFVDVKRVVSETALRNQIMNRWMNGPDGGDSEPEPAPVVPPANPPVLVAPPMVLRSAPILSDADKRKFGTAEANNFAGQIGNVNYVEERTSYKNQAYTIYKDPNDPDLKVKVAAINKGIKILIDSGLNIPRNLMVYSAGRPEAQNIGFKRGANWEPVAVVILGSKATSPMLGGMSSISQSGFRYNFVALDRPTITVIHELGHIIHERFMGDNFWLTLGGTVPPAELPNLDTRVSQYATTGKKEFVAEVFAGSIIGMKFPADIMAMYHRLGGPLLPRR